MLQVAEERALAGLCGSAMCTRPLPLKAGGVRRSLTNSTYCRFTAIQDKAPELLGLLTCSYQTSYALPEI